MADPALPDQIPLQDRDLLLRLSWYFDTLDQKLKQGQGWFIFNADSDRSRRISTFVERRLDDSGRSVDAFSMAWRDFALNAYVDEVGLPQLEPEADLPEKNPRLTKEIAFAKQLSSDLWDRFSTTDLLMVVGMKPSFSHEVAMLDRALEQRYQQRLATIILTPENPVGLETEFESLDPVAGTWQRMYSRLYETSLVAM